MDLQVKMLFTEVEAHNEAVKKEQALNHQLIRSRATILQMGTEIAQQQSFSADLRLQQLDLSNAKGEIWPQACAK